MPKGTPVNEFTRQFVRIPDIETKQAVLKAVLPKPFCPECFFDLVGGKCVNKQCNVSSVKISYKKPVKSDESA